MKKLILLPDQIDGGAKEYEIPYNKALRKYKGQ